MISKSKTFSTMMLKAFYCLLAITLLVMMFLNSIVLIMRFNDARAVKKDVDSTVKNMGARPFVFLTQTEQCLPLKLIHNLELSTGSKCRCDVIVLSYKKECREVKPPHVTYLFDNTTTWGSGRNTLFFHAMDKRPGYIYYIFTDDDISLEFNSATTPTMKWLAPISVFQNWLLEYGPAVGVVDYELRKEGQDVRNKMQTICGKSLNSTPFANPTIFFDPVFNAFHANAARHIFPLDTRHEWGNWWLTDKYVASAVELKFRGQALLFFPVTVVNPLHRSYPRSLRGTKEAWRGFIENIQRKAPAQYVNHSLFEEFKKDPALYVATSKTYCKNVTRHQPIAPFAHFDKEKSTTLVSV